MRKLLTLAVFCAVALPGQLRAQQTPFSAVAAENAFALDLYGKLGQAPGNLFFSPYSVATALDMVYVGARGTTADEMARVLHLEMLSTAPGQDLRKAVLQAGKWEQVNSQTPPSGSTFTSANALWGDKDLVFNSGFIADIRTSFGGDLRQMNFHQPAQAAAVINQWVAGQTKGKIQNLVSPDALQGDPAIVLTNAVYFKSHWHTPFDPAQTKAQPFHVSATRSVTADMMHIKNNFTVIQTDDAQILSMPYGDNFTSMAIILPNDAQGLGDIEAHLSVTQLDGWLTWLNATQPVPVILSMPKFKMGSSYALAPVLRSLGMTTAFDQTKADFTGIANDPARRVYVGAVVHKAFIDVDEQGTEAAAATGVMMALSVGIEPPPPPPVIFTADHPFIYMIYSTYAYNTGQILFMGRVDDPTH